ncbi:MAG TPA: phosphopantetheine-binding protein [Pseudoxanthomonas sp.]|nr:phosphopantetheine-binding protein [Pseudoxanthomonas sp.]
MIPAAFVLLPALPLTPNGKIDRKALPVPAGERADPEVAYAVPRTPTESRLAEIWQEVLGLTQVGTHDDFFEVGGHSLKATQLMSRIQQVFGIELPLRRVFEAPTIAELAADVARMGRGPGETALERILREVEALTDEVAAHQLDGNWSGG